MNQSGKAERRKKTLNRIHRIQGQLSALERTIESDTACEDVVTQARAVEKGVASLIAHVVGGYIHNQFREQYDMDPDGASEDMERLFNLITR